MILFQAQIEEHRELAEHYRDLAAKREALAAGLLAVQQQADSDLSSLKLLVGKCKELAPGAIASLKTAVLNLFSDGDNGGNQPTEPTPGPDDDSPELLCLNGLTGDCLTTGDKDDEELPVDDPTGDEWVLPSDAPLTGQTCDFDPDIYWEATPPDGSRCELASPLVCLIWEDAPLLGQHCTIAPSTSTDNENKGTKGEEMPKPSSTEMIHTSARTGYLKLKASGQILAAYAWFPRKDLAIAWEDWLDGMSLGSPELRPSKRNLSWKYEIKLTGLSMTQVERLSLEDLSRKPSKNKVSPAQAAGIEPPSDWGKVQPKENPSQLYAKVLLAESEYCGQTLPVSRVSPNEMGYTLTLPNGDNHWYRADMVQVIDSEIEEIALPTSPTDPIISKLIEELKVCTTYERYMELWQVCGVGTVSDAFNLLPQEDKERIKALRPAQPQPAELIEFNDVVEVVGDSNDCVGLVGSFGRVKVIKSDRIGVEIDEQLLYFKPDELSVKAKAEEPREQQLQSGQVLTGNRVVTTGAYFGTARRNAASMARMGTYDKVAALELVKAGLSPELAMAAATGTDDASDF